MYFGTAWTCHDCGHAIDKERSQYIITVIPRTHKLEKFYYHNRCFENRRRYVIRSNGKFKNQLVGKFAGRARNGYIILE